MSRFFSCTVITRVATTLNVETMTIRPMTRKRVVCWMARAEKRPLFILLQSVTAKPGPAAFSIARVAPSVSRIVSSLISTTSASASSRQSAPESLAGGGRPTPRRTRRSSSGRYGRPGNGRSAARTGPRPPARSGIGERDRVPLAARPAAARAPPRSRRPAAPRASPGVSAARCPAGRRPSATPRAPGRGSTPFKTASVPSGVAADDGDARLVDDRRDGLDPRHPRQARLQVRACRETRRRGARAERRPPPRWRRSASPGSPTGSPRAGPSRRRARRLRARSRRWKGERPKRPGARDATAGNRGPPRGREASRTVRGRKA